MARALWDGPWQLCWPSEWELGVVIWLQSVPLSLQQGEERCQVSCVPVLGTNHHVSKTETKSSSEVPTLTPPKTAMISSPSKM